MGCYKDDDTDDEGDAHTQDANDKDDETESNKDDIFTYMICVQTDEDERMLDVEVAGSNKGDEEVSDTAKANAEKTLEVKDNAKKTELPPSSSSLSVSSLMDIKIQSEVSQTQYPTILRVSVSVIAEPSVLTPIPETPLATTLTSLPPSLVSTIP
ncbi:hypothetical protein Tco_0186308 [Tanacetum coccineum]